MANVPSGQLELVGGQNVRFADSWLACLNDEPSVNVVRSTADWSMQICSSKVLRGVI